MTKWIHADRQSPPDGVAVEVITPGGDQRPLVYDRGLWWLPDRSMYCYFTPTFWRPVAVQRRGLR